MGFRNKAGNTTNARFDAVDIVLRPKNHAVFRLSPIVDFNGDGLADLAIGAPKDLAAGVTGGTVTILYGTASGLTATNSQLWSQKTSNIPEDAEPNDRFGAAVATGDVNGDGFTDLIVGVPGETINAMNEAGAIHVLYGSSSGLTAVGTQFFSEKTDGIPEGPETDDMFGAVLATGDFNGDGFADVAVGVPGESRGIVNGAGIVIVLYGSSTGLKAAGSQEWHQNTGNVLDKPEMDDHFGSSLAAGDFNGDGVDDLAIGAPLEDVKTTVDAGGVNVLYGGPSGLSDINNQFWTQSSTDIVDAAETGDQFGVALITADYNGDGRADLAIGVLESLGSTTNAGAVHVLYGTDLGLAATGSQFWTQNSTNVPDAAEAQDQFGSTLGRGDFNADNIADLVIGVPGEGLSGLLNVGAVHVLYGTGTGLSATGTQFWSQNSTNVLDVSETGDRFASALAAGDFNANGFDDLVVGVALEDLSGRTDVGAVHVILGGITGLTATGNQFWNQATSSVPGDLNAGDLFGSALAY